MRRKQTALLVSLLIFSSLAFVSQTRPQSPVSSTDPNEAEGTESPVTDQDGDLVPDLYEVIFGESVEIDLSGMKIAISGLNPSDSTDNSTDHDRDGLTALQEYCWPYTLDNCFEERSTLTGKPPEETESGLREYLDPRVSDTDGDGLPDGYEVHMCTLGGLYKKDPNDPLNPNNFWECRYFDPLDPSDVNIDFDRCEADFSWGCGDGFDFNSDGEIDVGEMFTNVEEYLFGTPDDWVTERDGLWCWGQIEGLTEDSCQDQIERPTGESGWMGSDPRFSDSDYFFWDELAPSQLDIIGDGIPDGWEAQYGLDPLNASDATIDSDFDGWDIDGDGFVTQDVTIDTSQWGEAFSNYEEYMVDFDDRASVVPGVRGFEIFADHGNMLNFDHSTAIRLTDSSVHSIIADQPRERLVIGSKYGITVLDPFRGTSSSFGMPAGLEINVMERNSVGGLDFLLLGSNIGFHSIIMENGIPMMESMTTNEIGEISVIYPIESESIDLGILLIGEEVWKVTFSAEQSTLIQSEISAIEPLFSLLEDAKATVKSIAQAKIFGRTPILLVGTDFGLIAWNSTDASEDIGSPWWVFTSNNADEFVNPDILDSRKTAVVNSIVVEESNSGSDDVWLGMGGGLHQITMDLFISQPRESISNERMLNLDGLLSGSNDVRAILPLDGTIVLGSMDGTWCLEGDSDGILGTMLNQTDIPGLVTTLTSLQRDGEMWIFAGISPGRFMNIAPMDPHSHDSDLDGMPDGWEFAYGLDPTDPFDGSRDNDADGVSIGVGIGFGFDRYWSNLEEYRFTAPSEYGHNGTDPRVSDTDGDGLTDGEEYWGWFLEPTNFECHYLNQQYLCDSALGQSASDVHMGGWTGTGSSGGSDLPTDPTNPDSDGDGMPDGWEIKHRRWIGDVYTGGNDWTLDPNNPDDANEDADGDGLTNLCEYEWERLRERSILTGIQSHGESPDSVLNWTPTNPNQVDSDGDSLPDGWEARYSCNWPSSSSGINPMNGSDALKNPDGDGFDVNKNGFIDQEEAFVNWLEYHMKSEILLQDSTHSGMQYPDNFTSSLPHHSWQGLANEAFGERTGEYYLSLWVGLPTEDIGSADPLNSDSDNDGMPDGWEIFHARWSLFDDDWTLNPVNGGDGLGDPDLDGMSNWEEYNSIDSEISESDPSISSPQFYLTDAAGALVETPWIGAESSLSFGHFLTVEQAGLTGTSSDPNNPDTDGDGLLDGIEVIFTTWNSTDSVWTLNPLVPNQGGYDSDGDGVGDLVELNLTSNLPINGETYPLGVPTFGDEAREIDNLAFENRVFRILFSKEGRADLGMDQYLEWKSGMPAKPMLQAIFGVTDPKDPDTDRDGMVDGYEYWFSEWNLEENKWTMNPLTDTDVDFDSDEDSFDCNGDGEISDSESFDNLAEFDSRWYGKRLEVGNVPNGTTAVSYGRDTVNALIEEEGLSNSAAWDRLYSIFSTKSLKSSEKMGLINQEDPNNFNKSLIGISDPTDGDSDGDGMPDGWEYCYSVYSEILPVNSLRWSLNPLNPLDVDYDPDADGWLDRDILDTPAIQGVWEDRSFSPFSDDQQFGNGANSLYFTNIMEYRNGTGPLDPDSDSDSVMMTPVIANGVVVDYRQDMSLSDGREMFKYGTNPLDNDTDGDMMPDFYEFHRGWNETNDNWSSYMKIQVQWIEVTPQNWKPIQFSDGQITRPQLDWTWFTHDATDPSDATQDADNDGEWECSGGVCDYVPYNNFQEYYAVVNATLSSPSIVRASALFDCSGEDVEEWWQLRETLLGTCSGSNSADSNYLRINRINDEDMLYALIIDDNDVSYQDVNSSNDVTMVNGAWTDEFNRIAGDRFHLPNIGLGEYAYGWWILDIDGDLVADGTDPTNWDTDGDWLNDFFEIDDDLLDGIRGNSGSPIRYDDRTS